MRGRVFEEVFAEDLAEKPRWGLCQIQPVSEQLVGADWTLWELDKR